jgi:hypothetical protein
MKSFAPVLMLSFLMGCSGAGTKNETPLAADSTETEPGVYGSEEFFSLSSYLTHSPVDSSDVQQIDSTCVIVITPTIAQMDAMTQEYGDDLESVVDDSFYYQGIALGIIDSLQLKRVDAGNAEYLKLKGTKQTYTLNVRKEGLPAWNIIFFHKEKEPEIVPSMDVTVEKTQSYFFIPTVDEIAK